MKDNQRYERKICFKNINEKVFGRWERKKSKYEFVQGGRIGKVVFLSQKAQRQLKDINSQDCLEAIAIFEVKEKVEVLVEFKDLINMSIIPKKVEYRVFVNTHYSQQKKTTIYADGREEDEYKDYPEYFSERPYTENEKKQLDAYLSLMEKVKKIEESGKAVEKNNREGGFQTEFIETGKWGIEIVGFESERIKAIKSVEFSATLLYVNEKYKVAEKQIFKNKPLSEFIDLEVEIVSEEKHTWEEIVYRDETITVGGGDGFRPPAHQSRTGKKLEEKLIHQEKNIVVNILNSDKINLWTSKSNIEVQGNQIKVKITGIIDSFLTGKKI